MSKRGPYKTYLCRPDEFKVPRQTKYNQRRLKTLVNNDEDDSSVEFPMHSADLDVGDIDDNEDESGSIPPKDFLRLKSTPQSQLLRSAVLEPEVIEDESGNLVDLESDFEHQDDDEEGTGTMFANDCFVLDEFDELSTTGLVEDNITSPFNDSLLYEGSPITVGESLLLTITFALTHNITGEALVDLLSLIACHCRSPNSCILTLSKFKKHFKELRSPLVCHFYCCFCFGVREKNDVVCGECGLRMTNEQADKSFFIESPVMEQLQTLFSRRGFYSLLSYPELRKKKNKHNIEDILDGSEYRRLQEKGSFLSFKNHFSFTVNTDGVALFRSSAFSIWPIYLQINELPPHLRSTSSNVIFAGLWFGEAKPYMDSFLQPLKSSLKNLQTQGNTCPTSARGHTHAYPMSIDEYKSASGHPPLRTPQSTEKYAQEAIRLRKPVKGVKGFSVLYDLKGFDIIKGVAVDYMHCVLLGVVKMLLNLWFDISKKGQPYFCGMKLEQVESRLLSIKPTMYVSRTPRSIENHRKYWKASELRAWLLYYSVPVMSGILPKKYLKHFVCLVRGIFLLLKDSISKEDLTEAKQLLSIFVFYMDVLYGERYCTANVHYLLHLTESVAWLGPLWATSCFAFENLNGFTKTLFHGTQHIAEQILTSVQIIQGIPTLESKITMDSPVDSLYRKMTNHQQSSDCRYEFAPGSFAIGAKKIREFGKNLHEDAAISVALQGQKGKCEVFSRCEVNSKVIHSLCYMRVTKRNTYTICFLTADQGKCYGQVSYYFAFTPICNSLCATVCNFHTPTYWALIRKFEFSEVDTLDFNQDDGLSFPIDVKSSQICTLKKLLPDNSHFHVLPISDILEVVSCIEFENDDGVLYVSHSPNTIEKD